MPALGDTAGQQVARRPAHLSDTCLIMSTSGTTGPPEGKRLDLWNALAVVCDLYPTSGLIPRPHLLLHAAHARQRARGRRLYGDLRRMLCGHSRPIQRQPVLGGRQRLRCHHREHPRLDDPPPSQGGWRAACGHLPAATAHHARVVVTAAAYRRVTDEWHIYPVCAYGLTDFGNLTISTAGEACPPGSCGRAVEDFEVRLVASDDEEVPRGAAGVVHSSGRDVPGSRLPATSECPRRRRFEAPAGPLVPRRRYPPPGRRRVVLLRRASQGGHAVPR